MFADWVLRQRAWRLQGSISKAGEPYAKIVDPITGKTINQDSSTSLGGQGDIWSICMNWHSRGMCSGQQLWKDHLELRKRRAALASDNGQVRTFPFCLSTHLPSLDSRACCATPTQSPSASGSADPTRAAEAGLKEPTHHRRLRPINGHYQKMPQVIKGMLHGPAHPLHNCPNPNTGNSRLWFSFLWLGGDRVSWSWASSPSSLARWVWA